MHESTFPVNPSYCPEIILTERPSKFDARSLICGCTCLLITVLQDDLASRGALLVASDDCKEASLRGESA